MQPVLQDVMKSWNTGRTLGYTSKNAKDWRRLAYDRTASLKEGYANRNGAGDALNTYTPEAEKSAIRAFNNTGDKKMGKVAANRESTGFARRHIPDIAPSALGSMARSESDEAISLLNDVVKGMVGWATSPHPPAGINQAELISKLNQIKKNNTTMDSLSKDNIGSLV
ncbi:MAG: hypothetical protein V1763_00140 [Parcubacteria group bacterium]